MKSQYYLNAKQMTTESYDLLSVARKHERVIPDPLSRNVMRLYTLLSYLHNGLITDEEHQRILRELEID
jgi:hypothetical protein